MENISCPYCKHKNLYILKDNYRKCKLCHKKFSLNKLKTDLLIIEAFCMNENALEVSKNHDLNYRTVANRYDVFRRLVANYLEELYYCSIQDRASYEEFYYFTQKQLQKKRKSLYDAINIIGFYSDNRVYTLLMPNLTRVENDEIDSSFERYLKWHKVQSENSHKTPLSDFWIFLSENLKKYKGINQDNFFFYLKECEFKYNFSKPICKALLKDLYFK